jgi:protein tyrosine phosphatase (PTP) superfamily phosphohydrolase (DUF442 family)
MTESAPEKRRRGPVARLIRWTLAVVLLLAAVAGAEYGHWALFRHRLVTIDEGRVYQSGKYDPDELVALVDELGLKSVVDFRDTKLDDVKAEREALAKTGARHIHIPSTQDPTPEVYAAFREAIADPDNFPMLIHCHHGEGRSVLFSAIYRIEALGWSNREAWRGAARLPPALRFIEKVWPGLTSFKPDSTKGRHVLEYERVSPAEDRGK